jgi:periplasmic divalent cation tolerance protein
MRDCNDFSVVSVATTVARREDAQRLARGLVTARLAACVQVEEGLVSHYRWQGALCEDAELRLTIKTLEARLEALQAFLAEHHPYEVPQFLVSAVRSSRAYADWVRAEVGG